MMKVLLLGATGQTGGELLQQALDRGHQVRALVRNPDKLTIKHDKLEVKKGNALSSDSLKENLEGCEAILSGLGHPGMGPFMTVTLYTDQAKAVVGALEGVQGMKFINISSWCSETKPENPYLYEWFFKPFMIGRKLANMAVMEKALAETENINYIVVRPGILTAETKTDKAILTTVEGQLQADSSYYISRGDVARFMLDCLETDQFNRKCVAIGVKK